MSEGRWFSASIQERRGFPDLDPPREGYRLDVTVDEETGNVEILISDGGQDFPMLGNHKAIILDKLTAENLADEILERGVYS